MFITNRVVQHASQLESQLESQHVFLRAHLLALFHVERQRFVSLQLPNVHAERGVLVRHIVSQLDATRTVTETVSVGRTVV